MASARAPWFQTVETLGKLTKIAVCAAQLARMPLLETPEEHKAWLPILNGKATPLLQEMRKISRRTTAGKRRRAAAASGPSEEMELRPPRTLTLLTTLVPALPQRFQVGNWVLAKAEAKALTFELAAYTSTCLRVKPGSPLTFLCAHNRDPAAPCMGTTKWGLRKPAGAEGGTPRVNIGAPCAGGGGPAEPRFYLLQVGAHNCDGPYQGGNRKSPVPFSKAYLGVAIATAVAKDPTMSTKTAKAKMEQYGTYAVVRREASFRMPFPSPVPAISAAITALRPAPPCPSRLPPRPAPLAPPNLPPSPPLPSHSQCGSISRRPS